MLRVDLEINNPLGHALHCQHSCTIRACCCFSCSIGSHLLTQASGESGNAKKKEKTAYFHHQTSLSDLFIRQDFHSDDSHRHSSLSHPPWCIKSVLMMAKPLLILAALTLCCCCVGGLHGETFFLFKSHSWGGVICIRYDLINFKMNNIKCFFLQRLIVYSDYQRFAMRRNITTLVLLILCSFCRAGLSMPLDGLASDSTSSHRENWDNSHHRTVPSCWSHVRMQSWIEMMYC